MTGLVEILPLALVGASALLIYYVVRLLLELRVDHDYEELLEDLRRLEARVHEMDMVDRIRPFLAPIPMMN